MRAFRKRFTLLNMCLAGIVLLTAFIVIGSFIYANEYLELKNTMSNVLKPWNADNAEAPKNNGFPKENEHHAEKKDKAPDKSDEKNRDQKSDTEKNREHDNNITTIFYDRNEKKASVLSEEPVFDDVPEEIAGVILNQDNNFGTLSQYHIIYYREATGNIVKIAVCNEAYIRSRLFKTIIILSLAYLLSMLLLFLISIRLSKFAERPLQRSIEMERKFVADISHDLKTPITVIMANNSILKANRNTTIAENMQWIESTDRASGDMMQLIGNMLTLSAVDTQPTHIHTVPVNLTSAVERCVLQFESVAYEKNVTMEESIENGLMVEATEEYLKRICSSLIENAFKYEPEGGKVIIEAYSRKHKAIFVIRNLNSRIAPDDLPHIFDRFYRGDKARTQSKGHGLGLPIIHQMTVLCGADIEAVSNDKDGTVFTVTFRKAS